jgi:hypothetical protein
VNQLDHLSFVMQLGFACGSGDHERVSRLLDSGHADRGLDRIVADVREPEQQEDPERFDGRDYNDPNWRP